MYNTCTNYLFKQIDQLHTKSENTVTVASTDKEKAEVLANF